MLVEGRKRKGKYIKKKSSIYEKVNIKEFSFVDVCKQVLIVSDNPNLNIIHARYHDKNEVQQSVKLSNITKTSVVEESKLPPVILPRDFTDDWMEQRLREKMRAEHPEDEDYDLALEELREEEEALKHYLKGLKKGVKTDDDQGKQDEASDKVDEKNPLKASSSDVRTVDSKSKLKDLQMPQKESGSSIEIVDKAIKKMSDTNPNVAELADDSNLNEGELEGSQDSQSIEESPIDQDRSEKTTSVLSVNEESNGSSGQENIQEVQPIDEEVSNKSESGSSVSAKNTDVTEIVDKLTDILEEMSLVKKKVLNSVQDNFVGLTKALFEALLDREIAANPDAVGKLISKAIESSVKDDEFKVHVSSDLYEKLKLIDNVKFKDKLVKDDSVGERKFKIESKLSVINSGVKDVIENLLEQVDLNLFDKEDK